MRILSFIMSVIALILSVFALCGNARAEVAVPEPFSFLNDFTGTIPDRSVGALEIYNRASDIQKNEATRTTVMTLIVPSTKGEPISDYAQRVAEDWHPGSTSEERGVLLVIAKSDKTWAIKTSRNVSGTLTDYNAKHLLNQMGAYLKKNKGDFAGAVILFYTEVPQYLKAPPKEVPVTPTAAAPVQSAEDEGFPGWAWALLFVLFAGGGSIAFYLWLEKKDEAERKQREEQALDALRQAREAQDQALERRRTVHSSWAAPAPAQSEARQSRPAVPRSHTPPPVVDNGEAERERKRQEALLAERNRQRREQEQREREAQRRREREAEEARQRRMRDDDRDSSVSDFATSVLAGALAGTITSSRSEPEPERESRSTYSAPEPEPDRGSSSESYDGGGSSGSFD